MFSKGISEIVLVVDDVQAAARFYREVVGLNPESEADDAWAWFWAGEPGKTQRVALHKGKLLADEITPPAGGEHWGSIHYAFEVPRDALERAVAHLKGLGVDVRGPVRWDWMKATSYYFFDPDGNHLEFWSPDV